MFFFFYFFGSKNAGISFRKEEARNLAGSTEMQQGQDARTSLQTIPSLHTPQLTPRQGQATKGQRGKSRWGNLHAKSLSESNFLQNHSCKGGVMGCICVCGGRGLWPTGPLTFLRRILTPSFIEYPLRCCYTNPC